MLQRRPGRRVKNTTIRLTTAIYYAAVLLNPTLKARWFEHRWNGDEDKEAWIKPCVDAAKELFNENYAHIIRHEAPSSASTRKEVDDFNGAFRRLHNHQRLCFNIPNFVAPRSDLDEYLERDTIPTDADEDFDLFGYWYERRNTTPGLVKLAFDTLAVPVSEAADERTFSSAALLMPNRRNRINCQLIEANEFLRSTYTSPFRGEFNVEADAIEHKEVQRLHQKWEQEAMEEDDT